MVSVVFDRFMMRDKASGFVEIACSLSFFNNVCGFKPPRGTRLDSGQDVSWHAGRAGPLVAF